MRISIKTEALRRILKMCEPALTKDPSRPTLMNIHFEVDQGKVTATGCDGFRMHIVIAACTQDPWEPHVFDLPRGIKLPKGDGTTFIDVDNTAITIITPGGPQLLFAQPRGEYMNTKAIIPKTEPDFTIDFNPKYIADACTAFADAGRKGVRFEFHGENGPCVLRFVEDDGSLAFLLPLRR